MGGEIVVKVDKREEMERCIDYCGDVRSPACALRRYCQRSNHLLAQLRPVSIGRGCSNPYQPVFDGNDG